MKHYTVFTVWPYHLALLPSACVTEIPPSSVEKKQSCVCYCATHCKHIRAFLKVNILFQRFMIAVSPENISLLPLNNSILKKYGSCYLFSSNRAQLQLMCLTFKHVCEFLNVNILFTGFIITVGAQNVSHLLLYQSQVPWKDCLTLL